MQRVPTGNMSRAQTEGGVPGAAMPRGDAARDARIARVLLLIALLPACTLALYSGLRDPRYLGVAALFGGGIAAIWRVAPGLAQRGWNPNWLLALAALSLAVLTPELALRSAGFRYESGIEFGYPRPSHFVAFEAHPEFFWTLRPGSEGVNSWGFPGPEIALPKPDGVTRIAVFGDSCSQSGYPEALETLLYEAPARRVEVIRLAVSGYSSFQGRRIAERHAPALGADLALVYFGWNDHWRAWGQPDAQKTAAAPAAGIGRLHAELLRRLRLVGFAEWLRDGVRGARRSTSDALRVDAVQYRDNLLRIDETLRAAGSTVVFLTAPTSYERFGVPPHVVEAGLAASAQDAIRLHRDYNAIVREVAAAQSAGLVDLAAQAAALTDRELAEVFLQDGIHFRPQGQRWAAEQIATALRSRQWLPR